MNRFRLTGVGFDNFKDADVPIAAPLEPGMAVIFQKDMDELINALRGEIPKAISLSLKNMKSRKPYS